MHAGYKDILTCTSQARKLLERLVVRDIYSVIFEIKLKSERKLNERMDEIELWITQKIECSKWLGVHVSTLHGPSIKKNLFFGDF